MPFDEVGVVTVSSGGRVYLSNAGAREGMTFTAAANENGAILLTPTGRTPVRPSSSEVGEHLEAARRGRALGAQVATATVERGEAVARLLRELMVDPTITESTRGIIAGAALGEVDRLSGEEAD